MVVLFNAKTNSFSEIAGDGAATGLWFAHSESPDCLGNVLLVTQYELLDGMEHGHSFYSDSCSALRYSAVYYNSASLKIPWPPPIASIYPNGWFCWYGLSSICLDLLCVSFVSGIISTKPSSAS